MPYQPMIDDNCCIERQHVGYSECARRRRSSVDDSKAGTAADPITCQPSTAGRLASVKFPVVFVCKRWRSYG